VLIPLAVEGIFVVMVVITAKTTNIFGSKFVIFRLVLQGSSIFLWLFMAYLGTLEVERTDYRGFRSKEYVQALPNYLSIFLEWITVFSVLLMLATEVVWALMETYVSTKLSIQKSLEKRKKKKEEEEKLKNKEFEKLDSGLDDKIMKVSDSDSSKKKKDKGKKRSGILPDKKFKEDDIDSDLRQRLLSQDSVDINEK